MAARPFVFQMRSRSSRLHNADRPRLFPDPLLTGGDAHELNQASERRDTGSHINAAAGLWPSWVVSFSGILALNYSTAPELRRFAGLYLVVDGIAGCRLRSPQVICGLQVQSGLGISSEIAREA